MIAPIIDF